jgi:hypothetical protein
MTQNTRPRPTELDMEKRLAKLSKLHDKGWSQARLIKYATETWDISVRQAQRYMIHLKDRYFLVKKPGTDHWVIISPSMLAGFLHDVEDGVDVTIQLQHYSRKEFAQFPTEAGFDPAEYPEVPQHATD